MLRRTLGVLSLMMTGCALYVRPVSTLAPDDHVVLELNDQGIPDVAPRLGFGTFLVDGKLQSIDSTKLVMSVYHTASTRSILADQVLTPYPHTYPYTGMVAWDGETVAVPKFDVASARVRRVSGPLVALISIGVAAIGVSTAEFIALRASQAEVAPGRDPDQSIPYPFPESKPNYFEGMATVVDRPPRDDEIDFFGVTHVGAIRTVNQDNFLIASIRRKVEAHLTSLPSLDRLPLDAERIAFLAMVADGVGGGPMGEAASRFAVEAVTQYVIQCIRLSAVGDGGGTSDFPRALETAAREVHLELIRQTEHDPSLGGMATTLTLWIGMWPRSYILQVGDSRCYILREGELTQLSRDQTMAQDLIDSGILSRTDAYRTRWVNVLSSAIGGSQNTPVVSYLHQMWGTVGLLCSDGLTKHVSDERIRDRLLTMTSAKQVCQDLVQDALDGGGTDNITVVVGRTVRRD